jgi:hypothetical protein
MSGELVIGNLAQDATFDVTVPLDRSILFTTLREKEASPANGGTQCILRPEDPVQLTPAGIRCRRNTPGTDTPQSAGEIHIRWTIATFTSGVTVQRGTANTGITNPQQITIAAADPAHSFILLGGIVVGGTGWGSNEFHQARLVDSTTLEVRATTAGSDVSWQVVTMADATVQRGTAAVATAETTSQITATNPGNLVLVSYTTDNTSSIAAASVMLRASAVGSEIRLERGLSGAALDVSWEAVNLPVFARSFSTTFAAGEATKTQAIPNLPASSSVAIASAQAALGTAGGSTEYDGTDRDLLGEAATTMTVADGAITLERASTTSAATIDWTVMDFGHDRCDDF